MLVKVDDNSQQESPSEGKLVSMSPSSLQMYPMPESYPNTVRGCSGGKCCVIT